MFINHKSIKEHAGNPPHEMIVGAGNFHSSGDVWSWYSDGLNVQTPGRLQNAIQRTFEDNLLAIREEWGLAEEDRKWAELEKEFKRK